MKRLDVFASAQELSEVKELHDKARSTPVMAMSVAHGMSTGGFSGEAWDRLKKRVHAMALSHGLPEIPGYYGIDPGNGQFIQA